MTTMTAAQIRAQIARMEQHPDPQVPQRPRPPRQYPAAYKLRILAEYERLDKAGKGALLRREGLTEFKGSSQHCLVGVSVGDR